MPWRCFMAETEADKAKPGAMWFTERDGECAWLVRLPNGGLFSPQIPSSTDGKPWTVSGEPPNCTVTPSIVNRAGWHGHLINGELVSV